MANIKFSQFTVGNTESDIDFVVGYKGANNIQISPANLLSATLAGYLPLSGGTMTGNVKFNDNIELRLGSGADLKAYHSGTHTYFDNNVGDLVFRNLANDKDIAFQSDDGSGGVTEYFRLDGTNQRNIFSKNVGLGDNVIALFGSGNDMQLFHDSVQSQILNLTGNLRIRNFSDDSDITFESDDGSGGIATYFYLDGSIVENRFSKATRHSDNIIAKFGDANDLNIYSNGSNSYIENFNNDFIISNTADDKDIIFQSDDGSGGVETYFFLDGSLSGGNPVTIFPDNSTLRFGSSGDLQLYHDASNSYIAQTGTGDLYIRNTTDDKDIIFQSDDGSGGITEYFKLDGSGVTITVSAGNGMVFFDNIKAKFGNTDDLQIFHNSTDSFIDNFTGNLTIRNRQDDGDIKFVSDDGSGGLAEYFRLDGGSARTLFSRNTQHIDSIKALFGNGDDLQLFHNGTDSFIENQTGHLNIVNYANDKDIRFWSDDGSGGITTYFRLDGDTTSIVVSATLGMYFNDGVAARFGTGGDLIIYHDGSNSYITDTGTGFLNISSDAALVLSNASGETYFIATSNGSTKLYYDNSSKLETRSTGIKISGVSEYADNTAAIAGGLTTGDVYRTGDLLKIVH